LADFESFWGSFCSGLLVVRGRAFCGSFGAGVSVCAAMLIVSAINVTIASAIRLYIVI
jgi:hypothetical protein